MNKQKRTGNRPFLDLFNPIKTLGLDPNTLQALLSVLLLRKSRQRRPHIFAVPKRIALNFDYKIFNKFV